MKNEEIIIEGLKENLHLEPMGKERVRVCSYVHKKDFPKVASAILSKLQTLKWDNIEKIILEHTIIKEIELKEGIKIAYRVIGPKGFGNIITEILALASEEGEVIAEGFVRITEDMQFVGDTYMAVALRKILKNYKKVQLIIREVK